MQAVLEGTSEPESGTIANNFKIDYKAAARDALKRIQQELATREIEQKSSSNSKTRELKITSMPLKHLSRAKAPSSLSTKLSVISGHSGWCHRKIQGRYLEVYGKNQVMLSVDGISAKSKTYVTTDNDQIGQIGLFQEKLKVHKIGHCDMMEQDAVHVEYEADMNAHLLDTNGKKMGVT